MATKGPTKRVRYNGSTPEPVPWSTIDALFDALVSPERHGLESWPEVMGTVAASWMDADGYLHRVDHLDELREAYEALKTYSVGFTCFGGDLLTSSFFYRPGAQPQRRRRTSKARPSQSRQRSDSCRRRSRIRQVVTSCFCHGPVM